MLLPIPGPFLVPIILTISTLGSLLPPGRTRTSQSSHSPLEIASNPKILRSPRLVLESAQVKEFTHLVSKQFKNPQALFKDMKVN